MTALVRAGLGLPPGIELRPASDHTIGFARQLYVATMRPLLQHFDAWDDDDMLAHFRAGYVPEQVRVIQYEGADVGYLQVIEAVDALTILQIHLVATARRRGIGTAVIRSLLAHAARCHKDILLSVVRHNPAIALYRRLGFEVAAEDRIRLHMRWRSIHSLPAPERVPPPQLVGRPGPRRGARRDTGS